MIGTKPYYNTELGNLYNADCLEVLKLLPDNCIDSCITDPPYGIGFMGKKWDYDVPSVEIWQQVLRILKPGGHILCACGTRTQHRMAVNLEDAGFEIRDIVAWLYGSGFPKSLDISKAIDKMANAERQVVGEMDDPRYQSKSTKGFKAFSIQGKGYDDGTTLGHYEPGQIKKTAPSTPEAKQWDGWGTALKPAMELFTLARKPLSEKTVAQNVLKHGVGGINIDECRVDHNGRPPESDRWGKHHRIESKSTFGASTDDESWESNNKGRFPANVILDEEAGKILDEQSGDLGTCGNIRTTESIRKKANINFVDGKRTLGLENLYKDIGGASRFFYCAKASKSERNAGLEEFEHQTVNDGREKDIDNPFQRGTTPRQNIHPTVKPVKLMEYLVKLITPENGIVIDPFIGSGTTAVACESLNRRWIGIEISEKYCEIAAKRIHNTDRNLF